MANKKTIWIINQYASHPELGMGGRHYYLARELAEIGYDIHIISSGTHHLLRRKVEIKGLVKSEVRSGVYYHWLKLPKYVNAHSKIRVFNWLLFPFMVLLASLRIKSRPSVVIYSSPSLPGFFAAELLAFLNRSKLFFEVRDIWPLTLIELGGLSPKNPLIQFFKWIEKRAYKKSTGVLSNLKGVASHIEKTISSPVEFKWVPNGFSQRDLGMNLPLSENIQSKLPKNSFIVGYAGSVGLANALGTLIDAANKIDSDSNISIVIVGAGGARDELVRRVDDLELNNIVFIDPVPKEQMPALLKCFDVSYIGWNNESIYRYGIGANKIPEYLAAGKPVLHSYSGGYDPVEEYKSGMTVPAGDSNALADAILVFENMSQKERANMGERGRNAALFNYEYAMLAKELERVLFND